MSVARVSNRQAKIYIILRTDYCTIVRGCTMYINYVTLLGVITSELKLSGNEKILDFLIT